MSEPVHTAERLAELQALPLDRKIQITQARIIEWYQRHNGRVVVSFSGGKDSTALLHLVRQIYSDVPAVYSNTGLEYPEIQLFVRSIPNVEIVTPKMRFDQVITKYGYPLIGKEVAEAIYFARRIRNDPTERERERETQQRCVRDSNCSEIERLAGGGYDNTHRNKSRQKPPYGPTGQMGAETVRQRKQLNGQREYTQRRSGRSCQERDKPGVPPTSAGLTGETGEGGVFSNSERQFGEKSMFNKEKWLPLVYTPFNISHYCCQVMKKAPLKAYQHKEKRFPFLGTLAAESRVRKQAWIRHGCNAFDTANPTSQPLSFWTEQDILQYIVDNGLEIAPVYGEIVKTDNDGNEYEISPYTALYDSLSKDLYDAIIKTCAPGKLKCTGCDRTGCIFCAFGMHLEKGLTRFQRLAVTHPKLYERALNGGQWVDNPAYDPAASEYDGEWKNWNPKQIWVPSKQGLGMKKVFDMVNEIYGKDFYRYE